MTGLGAKSRFPLLLAGLALFGCGKNDSTASAPIMLDVQGTIVDAQGNGVSGIDVAPCWHLYEGSPIAGTKTDGAGRYALRAPAVIWDPERVQLLALDPARSRGAIITHGLSPAAMRTRLVPLVTTRFTLDLTYANPNSEKTHIRIERHDGDKVYRSVWRGPKFEVRLPPDKYRLYVEGGDVEGLESITLNPAVSVVEYRPITLQPKGGWRSQRVTVKGSVVDAGNKAVPDAEISREWDVYQMIPKSPWKSDAQGRFTMTSEFQLSPGIHEHAVMCVDRGRKLGGFLVVKPSMAGTPQTIQLAPLVTVRARFDPGSVNPDPKNTKVEVWCNAASPVLASSWAGPEFVAKLPPGSYAISVVGPQIQHVEKDLLVRDTETEVNLGTIRLTPLLRSGLGGRKK